MTSILDDNRFPVKKHSDKAFRAVILGAALLLLLFVLAQLIISDQLSVKVYSIIAMTISIILCVTVLLGIFHSIKAMLNKEPNGFRKTIGVIGNSLFLFFSVFLILYIWQFIA